MGFSGPESSQDSDLNVVSFREIRLRSQRPGPKGMPDDWWKNHPTCDMECYVFNIYIYFYTHIYVHLHYSIIVIYLDIYS